MYIYIIYIIHTYTVYIYIYYIYLYLLYISIIYIYKMHALMHVHAPRYIVIAWITCTYNKHA